MEEKDELIQVRISSKSKQRIKNIAKERGQNMSDFLRESVDFLVAFDTPFWQTIEHISGMFNIAPAEVVQNVIVRYSAENIAREKVFPESSYYAMEFQNDADGNLLTGLDLLDLMTQYWTDLMTQHKKSYEKMRVTEARRWWNTPKRTPFSHLNPESRGVAERADAHNKKCKEIERTQGKEAASEYHREHKGDKA